MRDSFSWSSAPYEEKRINELETFITSHSSYQNNEQLSVINYQWRC